VALKPIGSAANVTIGAKTFINSEVRFAAPNDTITIGENVAIGPRVSFETVNHSLYFVPTKGRATETKPITVEDEAWIGAGCIILQGVTIGRGAVVAAGSVVVHDVPSYSVYGGSPAKFIKAIDEV
jgi:maltose O-acetyltransferase